MSVCKLLVVILESGSKIEFRKKTKEWSPKLLFLDIFF